MMPRSLFKYQSGRVIALGRVMLGILFLLAIWVDRSQSAASAGGTYELLIGYTLLAAAAGLATWRNWWLDARLAIVGHAVDMAIFTAIVFSANGSTTPFFLFFVLPLLSAAIRWSWRETALTAATLVVLYIAAGLLVAQSEGFELERFVVRSGHLMILSLLLIWFGIHQRFTRLFFRVDDLAVEHDARANPLAQALILAMQVSEARGGALVIAAAGEETAEGLSIVAGTQRSFTADRLPVREASYSSLLFDSVRNRAVSRRPQAHFQFMSATSMLDLSEFGRIGATIGLVAEVQTGTQRGWLVLWDIPDLSTDYLDFGRELGRAAGAILDRRTLLNAIESGAAARTRLSLARDVHDSIVQFLAGAAFRVEAVKRAARAGAIVEPELDELKRLLIEEQGEIRGFLMALRRDRPLELAESVAELRVLADRLSKQWSVECRIEARDDRASVPIRLQLDLQQLVREAVANAVRHGRAKRIDIGVAVNEQHLRLSVADNGTGFAGKNISEPWSLKERVERAHGSMRLESSPGSTTILVDLPLAGAAA